MVTFTENEPFSPIKYQYAVEKILYKGKSPYQDIMVFESPDFGRVLVLDNIVQLTERDEFFYHEMLSHIALHTHPEPRKVIVIGGGDGGTMREVLKHPSVKKAYLVEIDKKVVDVSREYLPFVSSKLDDPRVEIHYTDGAEFIKSINNVDVVIVDSTDAIGMARTLYSEEFFKNIYSCLSEHGLFVTHSESLGFHREMTIEVQNTLKKIFPIVDLYSFAIPTYPGNWWSFAIASKKFDPRIPNKKTVPATKLYDNEVHKWVFLPKGLYSRIMNQEVKW
ncbi:polyamine aminopropyltransferase [Desulfothermus okinawensis JCM 13304]